MLNGRVLALAGLVSALSAAVAPVSVQAQTIEATWVRHAVDPFAGTAVDAVTGVTYELRGYGPGLGDYASPTSLTRYGSAAEFEAGTGGTTVTLNANLWGTYFAANSGSVYGRTSEMAQLPNDAQVSKFDGTTGERQVTRVVDGMGGTNGVDTFYWGGFSGVNAANDGSHLYVMGGTHAADGGWRITTYDYKLNALNSVVVPHVGAPGWAFVIDGTVFIGDQFNSTRLAWRVDATSGDYTFVDWHLSGISGPLYLNNFSYDAFNDTLYLTNSGEIYKVANARTAFGISPVPESGTAAMFLAGLALLGLRIRR